MSHVLTLKKTRLTFLMFHSGLALGDRLRGRKLKINKGRSGDRQTKKSERLVTWLQRFVAISGFPGRAVFK